MLLSLRTALSGCVLMAGVFFAGSAHATVIEYQATDLTDATPGEDLWRYEYRVGRRSFLASQFFDIYFDPLAFGTLAEGPAPNADWDVLVLQNPTPSNPAPFDVGIFNSFARTGNASLTGMFSVSFIYLGGGRPRAQEFAVFDADGTELETGLTRPFDDGTGGGGGEIPEPATAALFALGLALAAVKRRRA